MSAPPAAEPWATRPLADLLAVIASRSAPVGGGSAAAVVAARRGGARRALRRGSRGRGLRARAEAARSTLADLIDIDAAALVALMQARDADDEMAALVPRPHRHRSRACGGSHASSPAWPSRSGATTRRPCAARPAARISSPARPLERPTRSSR